MKGSLRKKLILSTTLAMLAVYLAASVVIYATIRRSLYAGFDNELAGKVQSLVWLTETDDRNIKMEIDPRQVSLTPASEVFLLFTAAGKTLYQTPEMNETLITGLKAAATTAKGEFTAAEGQWRFATQKFRPRDEDHDDDGNKRRRETPEVTMIVARRTDALQNQLVTIAWLVGGVFAGAMLISAGVMAWLVGRGLRPLGALARRIETIGDNDLSARVDASQAPAELRPVVDRLNELLVRLESAFAREKTFTADIAHELRTPLAGLTTALEVCATQQRSPQEYEHVLARCLKATRAMRMMVENLLMLARVDAKQVRVTGVPLDLPLLLEDAWREFAPLAQRRGLHIAWQTPETLPLSSDRSLLSVVFRNLFDNAARYAAEGGTISISMARHDKHATVTVENTGSQVAATDADKVFDRFWRGDAARSGAGEHCGLGLALCKRVMSVLDGSITVKTERGGPFAVTITLPIPHSPTKLEHAEPEGELITTK